MLLVPVFLCSLSLLIVSALFVNKLVNRTLVSVVATSTVLAVLRLSLDMDLSLQMLQIPSHCNSLSVIVSHINFHFSLLIVVDFTDCYGLLCDYCTSSNKPVLCFKLPRTTNSVKLEAKFFTKHIH